MKGKLMYCPTCHAVYYTFGPEYCNACWEKRYTLPSTSLDDIKLRDVL